MAASRSLASSMVMVEMMMPSITFSRRVTIVTSLPSEKLLNSNTLSNNVSPATSQDSTSRTREGTTSRRCRRSLHDRGNHIELCELFEMLMTAGTTPISS